jgi:hypothetical protein
MLMDNIKKKKSLKKEKKIESIVLTCQTYGSRHEIERTSYKIKQKNYEV